MLGLSHYTRSHNAWQLQILDITNLQDAIVSEALARDDVLGACLFGSHERLVVKLLETRKSQYSISARLRRHAASTVTPDHHQAGRLAADHLSATGA